MIVKKFDSLSTNASEQWTFMIYRPGRGGGGVVRKNINPK